jgi:hypothetical protein
MQRVTLATYPLPDRDGCYWDVQLGGMPLIAATESQADAVAVFERVCGDATAHGAKIARVFWDGYSATETVL